MDTHHPSKELAISLTNKDGKEYNKHHIPGNIWVREKTKVTYVIDKSEDGSGPGQVTSAGYEITDGHYASPPGNPMKGIDLEEGRGMWKQHAEAFVQSRDTMTAQ